MDGTQEKTAESADCKAGESAKTFWELSRKILLASVGAAAVAEEEITSFMGRMIERGEMAEKDARRLMREVLERREKILRERREAAEHKDKAAAASPADLADLQAKVAELTRQIEALKAAQGKGE